MSFEIIPYAPPLAQQWDRFIETAVNGSFLFKRNFMDYHAHRFQDHSLIITSKQQWLAVIPGHIKEHYFYSHRGLTFGYPVLSNDAIDCIGEIILSLNKYFEDSAFAKAEFNLPTSLIHKSSSNLLSVLQSADYSIARTHTSMIIDLSQPVEVSRKKSAGYDNGKFDSLELHWDDNFNSFWNKLLIPELKARYDAAPVHSLTELEKLKKAFPEFIKQCNIYHNTTLVAGITIFIDGSTVKSQYSAISSLGKQFMAMDYAYQELIKWSQLSNYSFMDLGTVNKSDDSINQGLQFYKTKLGAQSYPVYRLEKTF